MFTLHDITAFTPIKIRGNGLVTWDRFIKWDEISEIEDKKDGVSHRKIVIHLKDRNLFKKVVLDSRNHEINDEVVKKLKTRIGK